MRNSKMIYVQIDPLALASIPKEKYQILKSDWLMDKGELNTGDIVRLPIGYIGRIVNVTIDRIKYEVDWGNNNESDPYLNVEDGGSIYSECHTLYNHLRRWFGGVMLWKTDGHILDTSISGVGGGSC